MRDRVICCWRWVVLPGVLASGLGWAATGWAVVAPNPLFQDHMILQRQMPVPVWGAAEPGEEVTVTFAGQTRKVTAGADRKWLVKLDPLEASATPAEMTIVGANRITISDVLVGEVWLASGQSNMTMRFSPSQYPREEAEADQPEIRIANVDYAASLTPQDTVGVSWTICTPQTIGEKFSAVGYFFAKRLHDELQVPVAIIHSSWEGTQGESWVSREALLAQPGLRESGAAADRRFDPTARGRPGLSAEDAGLGANLRCSGCRESRARTGLGEARF